MDEARQRSINDDDDSDDGGGGGDAVDDDDDEWAFCTKIFSAFPKNDASKFAQLTIINKNIFVTAAAFSPDNGEASLRR